MCSPIGVALTGSIAGVLSQLLLSLSDSDLRLRPKWISLWCCWCTAMAREAQGWEEGGAGISQITPDQK